MIVFTAEITAYFLPEDRETAKNEFLSLLTNPYETWISAYALTMQELAEHILEADAKGVIIHLLLDRLQASGPAESKIIRTLQTQMRHGDIVLTTAGAPSPHTSEIWHTKGMVVENEPEPDCWEGSVNFSENGWYQGNTAMRFRSKLWAESFKTHFLAHRQWALEHISPHLSGEENQGQLPSSES